MATVITAGNATNGLSFNADNTGSFDFKTGTGAGTSALSISSSQAAMFSAGVSGTTGSFSGNMSFNSGYGSAAVAYGCRAWVNFDGTAASPITARASANISSITKASTSDYTINFTTAMPDINYSIVATTSPTASYSAVSSAQINSARASTSIVAPTTSAFALSVVSAGSGAAASVSYINVAVFR